MLKTLYYDNALGAILYQPVAFYLFTLTFIQYVVMIYLSEQVRLIELETEQLKSVYKSFTGNCQKSWTAYLFTKKMIQYPNSM